MKKEKISCAVVNVHTLKPVDRKSVMELCSRYRLLVTVEEHNVIGGLGTMIADILAEMKEHPPIYKIGINDEFPHAGEYAYLLDACGLTAQHIKEAILEKYKEILN